MRVGLTENRQVEAPCDTCELVGNACKVRNWRPRFGRKICSAGGIRKMFQSCLGGLVAFTPRRLDQFGRMPFIMVMGRAISFVNAIPAICAWKVLATDMA